jgi:hypothetical protein
VKQYRRYRNASRELNNKIIKALVDNEMLDEAVPALGLGKNRQLFVDSKDDLDVLMDYALYEVPRQGKNVVQRYQQEKGGSSRVERELLAAMVKARTGLFKVERVSPWTYSLDLRKLVDEEKAITLTDVNFSQTMAQRLVVFFRPIELPELTMTSGIAFVFPEGMERDLVAHWKRWDSTEHYARFFKMSKSRGLATIYEEAFFHPSLRDQS